MRTRTACGIWWVVILLVACSDLGRPPSESQVGLPDSADQVVFGFTKFITIEGVERAQLGADSAFHVPAREEWLLFNLSVTFRSAQGEIRSTLTAKEGTYNWRTGNMVARDSVVAVTPDGRRLNTCEITYDEGSDQITGPCAFEYDAPGERLTGESFEADPDFRNVTATRPAGTVSEIRRNP